MTDSERLTKEQITMAADPALSTFQKTATQDAARSTSLVRDQDGACNAVKPDSPSVEGGSDAAQVPALAVPSMGEPEIIKLLRQSRTEHSPWRNAALDYIDSITAEIARVRGELESVRNELSVRTDNYEYQRQRADRAEAELDEKDNDYLRAIGLYARFNWCPNCGWDLIRRRYINGRD